MYGCWGACVVAGDIFGYRGAYVWLPGGIHGCWGACVVAGGGGVVVAGGYIIIDNLVPQLFEKCLSSAEI